MMAQRGFPSGERSIASMSIGSPVSQVAKEGEASNPLSLMAKAMRSVGGKKASSSSTPSLRMGGCCTCASSVPRSRLCPLDHAFWIRLASRMCSREESGSPEMPSMPRTLVTYPSISSLTTSGSVSTGGAVRSPTMLTGRPADEPGV